MLIGTGMGVAGGLAIANFLYAALARPDLARANTTLTLDEMLGKALERSWFQCVAIAVFVAVLEFMRLTHALTITLNR